MQGEIDNFLLDLSGYTEEELESGGRVPPGKYHCVFQSVKEDLKSQKRCLAMKLLTLAGTDPNGVGMILTERLYLTEEAKKRVAMVVKRFGLAPLTAGARVNFCSLAGVPCVVEIIEEDYEHSDEKTGVKSMRKRSKVSYAGFWPMNDERIADVPRSTRPLPKAPVQAPALANGRQPAAVGAGASQDDFSDM